MGKYLKSFGLPASMVLKQEVAFKAEIFSGTARKVTSLPGGRAVSSINC